MIFSRKGSESYENDKDKGSTNSSLSPIYDMLNTCKKFGVYCRIKGYVEGASKLPGKQSWKRYIWERAWVYEDMFWDSTSSI